MLREKVKNLVFVDEMDSFGMQTNKMSAILSTLASDTGFNTEEIRIGAVGALSQRDTDLRNGDMA